MTINSPSYGIAAGQFSNGIPYSAAALTATNFDPGAYPNVGQLNSPPTFTVPNNGRPARFVQSTIGFEREVVKDLSVEASFIDNRGVWLESDGLRGYQPTPCIGHLRNTVWTLPTRADFNLLTQPISSPSRSGERLQGAVLHLPVRSQPWLRHYGHSRNSAA